jgi:hypothetical protein
MTCSARSLGSARSPSASRTSSSGVAPRGRVPAGGCTTAEVPVTVTSASGEEPTTSKGVSRPAKRSRYMYGEGLLVRSTR